MGKYVDHIQLMNLVNKVMKSRVAYNEKFWTS